MNDAERWIYFDGPEPAHLRPLLDALRELPPPTLPPPTPEDKERVIRRILERLDARYPRGQAPAGGVEAEREGSGTAGAPNAPKALIEPKAPVAPIAPIAAPDVARRGNKDDATARSLTFEDREDVLPRGARHVPKAR
jgi:hypothetical protein